MDDETEMTDKQWEEWLKARNESKDWLTMSCDGAIGVYDDEGKKVV